MTRRLVATVAGNPLPVRLPGGLCATVTGDALHVLSGAPREPAHHLAINAAGAPLAPASDTGLPPAHDAAAHDGALLVSCVGERAGSGVPVLATVDLDGEVRQRRDVPAPDGVGLWARLADGRAFWASADPARYHTATMSADGTPDIPPEQAVAIDVATVDRRVLLASVLADRLVLRVLNGDRVVAHREWPDDVGFVRVGADGHGWWLLAGWRGRDATLGQLDAGLDDAGTAAPLPGPVRDGRLVTGGPVIAVLLRYGERVGHRMRLRDTVALVDDLDGAVALTEAGAGYWTAGWVGERLVVVHGELAPLVTVFTA